MRIADVVKRKGGDVVTVRPGATVTELLALLAEHRIGAVVVSEDGDGVHGIVSERDVVRHLHTDGAALLDAPVSQIMTADVHTCTPEDALEDMAAMMTDRRIRHVPVVIEWPARRDRQHRRHREVPHRLPAVRARPAARLHPAVGPHRRGTARPPARTQPQHLPWTP